MTPDRFAALADAYGANPDRWPEAERDAAWAFLRGQPDRARAMLEGAVALDSALACWTVPGPGAALSARVVATLEKRRSLRRRARLFLSGLGAALTLAGGVAAGVNVLAMPPAADQATNSLYTMSVLGQSVEDGPVGEGDQPAQEGRNR